MAGLLGLTPSKMNGRPFTDFLPEPSRPIAEEFLSRQQTHSGERIELTFRRDDDSELYALVAGSPIVTPKGVFVGTMLCSQAIDGNASLGNTAAVYAYGFWAGALCGHALLTLYKDYDKSLW